MNEPPISTTKSTMKLKWITINTPPIDPIHIMFRLLIGIGSIIDGLVTISTFGFLDGEFGLSFAILMSRRNYRVKHNPVSAPKPMEQ